MDNMQAHENPAGGGDSLDRIELLMAMEEAGIPEILDDESLSAAQREQLILELEARLDRGE